MHSILQRLMAGWLDDLTGWLKDQLVAIWKAFMAFMLDLFLAWVEQTFAMIVYVLSLIPKPSVLSGQSLGSMLGSAGPTILWFVDVFQIGPSMTLIAGAMVFFIVRRLLTLGIW